MAAATLNLLHSKKLCVISKKTLLLILELNANYRQKTLETWDNISKVLEIIVKNRTGRQHPKKLKITYERVLPKLDELIVALSDKNVVEALGDERGRDMIKKLQERYSIKKKSVEFEKLSSYYTDMLKEKTPYVPKRFRTAVNPKTPEFELKYRRNQSINAMNTEIQVMEERASSLNEKIEELNRQITSSLMDYDSTKVIVSKRMEFDDQKIREEFEKNCLMKLKDADEICRKTSDDHMLIYMEDKIVTEDEEQVELTDSLRDRNRDC